MKLRNVQRHVTLFGNVKAVLSVSEHLRHSSPSHVRSNTAMLAHAIAAVPFNQFPPDEFRSFLTSATSALSLPLSLARSLELYVIVCLLLAYGE